MLIYSNFKNSTRHKPLTVCTCWNPCVRRELWRGWSSFCGQNLSSWGHSSAQISAGIRDLSHSGADFILILPIFVFCWILLQEKLISSQTETIGSLCSRATSPSLTEIDTDSSQKSICLFLSLWRAKSCTREVQGWERLQMEKRKDIWESSLNNQRTDGFRQRQELYNTFLLCE